MSRLVKGRHWLLAITETLSCEFTLSRCCPEGWKTTLAGSRLLNDAEQSYAAIQGEALQSPFHLYRCTRGQADQVFHPQLLGRTSSPKSQSFDENLWG